MMLRIHLTPDAMRGLQSTDESRKVGEYSSNTTSIAAMTSALAACNKSSHCNRGWALLLLRFASNLLRFASNLLRFASNLLRFASNLLRLLQYPLP
jgi:hypothetical protein